MARKQILENIKLGIALNLMLLTICFT